MKESEKMFKLPAISLALFVIYLTICKVAIKNKKKPLRKRNGFERKCRYIFSDNAEWEYILHSIK
nr:MAG TPA: hypothetical protein [Caudoviricetes sp.]